MRTPLDHGSRWATTVTVAWVIGAPALIVTMTWEPDVQLMLALVSLGMFSVLLGVTRPRFFWTNSLVDGWRWAFGDRGVAIIYVTIGLGLIAAVLIGNLAL